jgi:hypothetical protein
VRYLAAQVPWPYPAAGALHFIRDLALPAVERGEAWHWTLRLKSDPGQIIGSIDLRKKENDNRGFWLGLAWQRQGLMSEACEAVTDFWFNTLGFPVLRAPKPLATPLRAASPKNKVCAWSRSKTATMFPAASPLKSGKSPPRNGAPANVKFCLRVKFLTLSSFCFHLMFAYH